MKTIENPQITDDGCYTIYNGNMHEVYQDQEGAFYIIDFENANEVIYLNI